MKIVLSSNPYRDKGLRVALEARRILEHADAQTVLCLPFQPRKGDRLDLPKQAVLSTLDQELPTADLLICFGGDGTILHAARAAWALWPSWSGVSCRCWPRWPMGCTPSRSG